MCTPFNMNSYRKIFTYLDIPIQDSGKRSQKRSSRQKRDQKIASLLILVVTVFACCNMVSRLVQRINMICLIFRLGLSSAFTKSSWWHSTAATQTGQYG